MIDLKSEWIGLLVIGLNAGNCLGHSDWKTVLKLGGWTGKNAAGSVSYSNAGNSPMNTVDILTNAKIPLNQNLLSIQKFSDLFLNRNRSDTGSRWPVSAGGPAGTGMISAGVVPLNMEENVKFKQAALQDLPELSDLSVKTFYPAFGPLNTEANMQHYMNNAFSETQLRTELTDPACLFYLVQAGDRLAGYMKLNFAPAQTDLHDPDSLEIQRIYVLPEFQGLRLGGQMIRKAIAVAAENRLKYIWLGVWEKNSGAIRFYERHGFRIAGSHPFPFGDEIQTDLIMKLLL